MNEVFYAPEYQQMTISITDPNDVSVTHESDGTILVSIEKVSGVEFFSENTPLWRAVK